MVQNNVAQCIAHIKLPAQYGEPFCRCLGSELERNFSYAQIREYRLKTDNWTYFADVADDPQAGPDQPALPGAPRARANALTRPRTCPHTPARAALG